MLYPQYFTLHIRGRSFQQYLCMLFSSRTILSVSCILCVCVWLYCTQVHMPHVFEDKEKMSLRLRDRWEEKLSIERLKASSSIQVCGRSV